MKRKPKLDLENFQMNSKNQTGALDALQGFLHELRSEGSVKVAETGDNTPSTAAPIKEVDNGTRKPVHGERYSENTSDVRKALGSAGVTGQEDAKSVGDKSEASNGELHRYTADESAPQKVKDNPMKPKDGSGPGDTTYGDRKYASLREDAAALRTKLASNDGGTTETPKPSENAIPKKPVGVPAAPKTEKTAEEIKQAAEEKRAAATEYEEVAALGYEIAQNMAATVGAELEKQGSEGQTKEAAVAKIAHIQSVAADDALFFVDVMRGYNHGMKKKAEGEGGAGGGALPPGTPAEMTGGAPGAEGDMPPGGGEGGGGGEEKIEALAQALEQAGVSPEELAEAIVHIEQQQGGGGGEGGAPGGEGGGGAGGMPIPQ